MYAPTYAGGFGQGASASNAQQHQQSQIPGYNQNAVPHSQPSIAQQPHQQQMMYNPQQGQYPGGPGGPSGHQSPYGAQPGVPLMQNANGMAHMAGNNGIAQPYQTPYTSSPYGAGVPSSTTGAPQQSYMTPTSNSSFNMNLQAMNNPHQQRMQPPQNNTPVSTAQRISPYGNNPPQNNPPHAHPQQSQFMPPQNQNQQQQHQHQQHQSGNPGQLQTQHQPQQTSTQPNSAVTPQTPSFPNSASGPAPLLSPGAESREKARVSLLLDINRELLMEVMRLQQVQAEAKKESGTEDKDKTGEEKKPAAVTGKEYVECMRRLQSNLAYLAAIADRSHKPSSQIPPHPAIISAPPLSPIRPTSNSSSIKPESPSKKTESTEDSSKTKTEENGIKTESRSEPAEDRLATLRQQYARLQALFPGVDPKKEPPLQGAKGPAKPGAPGAGGQRPMGQQQGGQQGGGGAGQK